MDYVEFCRTFFTVTRVPVSLLKNKKPIYATISEMVSLPLQHSGLVPPLGHNPEFCCYSPDFEYGRIDIEGTDYTIALGPVFSIPISEELTRTYMRENAVPLNYKDAVFEFLTNIPQLSHLQFAKHLSLIHMALNNKKMDLNEFNLQKDTARECQHTDQFLKNQEHSSLHNTYSYEQELYKYIKEGNEAALKNFLHSKQPPHERKLANTPLRQAKNLFILTVSKIGMLAAIPAGIDIEKTYQLVEMYIQECEQLQRVDSIYSLQYSMVFDFCRKASECQIPEGISPDLYKCMNYIRSHTNESITVEDVAKQIHRSSSYLSKSFKQELGISVGAFIMRCKLEEAKSLLKFSALSLAEISNYLCFSSQSYFQNVFKKKYHITPNQYRKMR